MISSHEQEIWMIHDVHDTDTNMWVSYNGILPFRVREITLNPVSLYSVFQKTTEEVGALVCTEDEAWAEQEPLQVKTEGTKLTPDRYGHWTDAGKGPSWHHERNLG